MVAATRLDNTPTRKSMACVPLPSARSSPGCAYIVSAGRLGRWLLGVGRQGELLTGRSGFDDYGTTRSPDPSATATDSPSRLRADNACPPQGATIRSISRSGVVVAP